MFRRMSSYLHLGDSSRISAPVHYMPCCSPILHLLLFTWLLLLLFTDINILVFNSASIYRITMYDVNNVKRMGIHFKSMLISFQSFCCFRLTWKVDSHASSKILSPKFFISCYVRLKYRGVPCTIPNIIKWDVGVVPSVILLRVSDQH